MEIYYSDVLMPRKVCALAQYLKLPDLKLPVEFHYLDLGKAEHKAPAYLALNPAGAVPTLVHDGHVLIESDAILVELARLKGSPLWPEGEGQAHTLRWMFWNAHHFAQVCGRLYFEHVIKPRFAIGAPDAAASDAALAGFRKWAPVLEAHLSAHDWLANDALSIADFAVANPFAYAGKVPYPLAEFPAIARWNARMNDIDAWRQGFPHR